MISKFKIYQPFPKRQIFDSSKVKKFADDNSKFDENGSKLSELVENTVRKGVFQNSCAADRKNQGLFGKWLKPLQTAYQIWR